MQSLQRLHAETLSDIALLCLNWRPDGRRPELVEEVLEFLDSVAPFFDERILHAALKDPSGTPSYSMKLFAGFVDEALGLDDAREHTLTDTQREQVIERLAARLLVRLTYRTYEAYRETSEATRRCLALVERARKLDPNNVHHQITATRFQLLGGYYDDARATLALVHARPAPAIRRLPRRSRSCGRSSPKNARGTMRAPPATPPLTWRPVSRAKTASPFSNGKSKNCPRRSRRMRNSFAHWRRPDASPMRSTGAAGPWRSAWSARRSSAPAPFTWR